jgi:hypothetical protein
MNRWVVLKSAAISNLLHKDFHQENALYSEKQIGFFHDLNKRGSLISVESSIQLIDWGDYMEHPELISDIKQLFIDMRTHITKFPDHFVINKSSAVENAKKTQTIYDRFNQRIKAIFDTWIEVADMYNPSYLWVINLDADGNDIGRHTEINSHIIMFYDRLYFNRTATNDDAFKSVVRPADREINRSIARLI